jgi:hypothetical protein
MSIFSSTFRLAALLAVSSALTLGLGCSRSEKTVATFDSSKPVVLSVKTAPLTQQPDEVSAASMRLARLKAGRTGKTSSHRFGADFTTNAGVAVAVSSDITLARAQIMGRTFLYGSDLQYSSLSDSPGSSMMLQSMSVGHWPAQFHIIGDRLQLIADQRHLFESNINHPGRLINEFPIVAQDADTITIRVRQASPVLVTIMSDKAPTPRTTWVRSVEFVPDGNLLLMETSIETPDGKVAEFMESLFPRDVMINSDSKTLFADPDLEPLAGRFRFLSGDPLYVDIKGDRTRTKVANRFQIRDGKPVEWYVTANIPSEYMVLVKTGIEGWNRYSQKMWNRDIVKFMGKLPEGIKIGDPRYNIVNWDSITDAGAAYESQAFDPYTGLQSHSLIYLPYAWVKIGESFWTSGSLTQVEENNKALQAAQENARLLGQKIHVSCFHDATQSLSVQARTSPQQFARELLKQVLFHEVGHALGLAHNFKGSLSFNPGVPGSVFSTSIMDYNQYQIEGGAYESESSANGPLLEYDRQILSALYNDAKDIATSDPVLPACADDEADQEEGGIDPLCIRYDAGEDPTLQLVRTLDLVRLPAAKITNTRSLVASLTGTVDLLGDPEKAMTEADAKKAITLYSAGAKVIATYYYASGAQSLRSMMSVNLRTLRVFGKDILPPTFNEIAMRSRVISTLQYVSRMEEVEPDTKVALNDMQSIAQVWLMLTPWYAGLADNQKSAAMNKVLAPMLGVQEAVETTLLSRVRQLVFANLKLSDKVPFYFNANISPLVDAEQLVLTMLEDAVSQPLKNGPRPAAERLAAASAIVTFKATAGGAAAIARATSKLTSEAQQVRTASERDALRKILQVLGK